MNTTVNIYIPDKEIAFMRWAKNRFNRNFSKATIDALHEYVGDEWDKYLSSLKGIEDVKNVSE